MQKSIRSSQFHTYFGLIANTVRRYWPFNLLGCAIVTPQHLLLQMQAIALENPRADCNSEIQQEEQLQFQLVQFNVGYSPDSRIECVVKMPSIYSTFTKKTKDYHDPKIQFQNRWN